MSFSEKSYTLVFCRDQTNEKILLGMKKRGFGAGKWNGFGGKVEEGETVVQAAKRELEEECGLIVKEEDLESMGYLVFKMNGSKKMMKVYVYQTKTWEGNPIESDEMRPQFFNEKEIPYEDMWPDDKHHLPLLLEDKRFIGRFEYDSDDETILEINLKEQ